MQGVSHFMLKADIIDFDIQSCYSILSMAGILRLNSMRQAQEIAQIMAAIIELESDLLPYPRKTGTCPIPSDEINGAGLWSNDPLYLIIGVNTLLPEHAGHRHAHRYFFWKRTLNNVQLNYFISCDIEAYKGYGDIDMYVISDNGYGARMNHTVTNAPPAELTVDCLCSDIILCPWRPATSADLNGAIEATLLDDIYSPNCRVRRENRDVLNATPFYLSTYKRGHKETRAIRGSVDEFIERLKLRECQ